MGDRVVVVIALAYCIVVPSNTLPLYVYVCVHFLFNLDKPRMKLVDG